MKANFGPSRAIEIAYERGIRKLLGSALPPSMPRGAGVSFNDWHDWIAQLQQLSSETFLTPIAERLAHQMIAAQNIRNAKAWREACARSQKSRLLYRLLQEELEGPVGERYYGIIRKNAELIRSIPADVAVRLNRHLAKAQQAGMRAEAVAQVMRAEFPRLTSWKVNLIARTEVAKAASALTEAKSRDIGLAYFEWNTVHDQRVRRSHRLMDGVIIGWDDLPHPELLAHEKDAGRYGPGGIYNCRCGANPLLSLADVSWPRRVYHQGRIERMTRMQFAQFSGVQERVAA